MAFAGVRSRARIVVGRGKHLKTLFDGTRVGRMLGRYGEQNGNVLAGGIAYYSLVSIAAGLIIGATIVSFLAQYVPWVRSTYFQVLQNAVPGVVGSGGSALVSQNTTLANTATGLVGLFALLLGANRAARFIGGLRTGVVTMLGRDAGNPLQGKLRDFLALVAIALIVTTGLVVQFVASRAAQWLVGVISDGAVSPWLLRVPALVVGLVIDMLFVAMAIVVLGHARAPWRRLWPVLLVTATVIGVLRLGSSALVGSAASNAVLASIAAVVTLLIFVDFTTRAILMAAAWLGSYRTPQVEGAKDDASPGARTDTEPARRKVKVTTRRATVRREP
ncbi:YihY/virulence factor BrkB family protein [Demequina lutea]|uniref:Membrane protein n=1 Tax=Demequina lutea TaxID=431489 RepID=A0A7Y9ZE05_9MICO|nr:YhjD/YihY/BrkB family envelope integrity protein [Demequina lutea]NYI42250.1 membrane protein [Demequina lutea]